MHQLSQDLLKQKKQRSKQSKGDRLYLQFLWLRWPINQLQTSQRHTSLYLSKTKRKKEETLKTILPNDIPHVPGIMCWWKVYRRTVSCPASPGMMFTTERRDATTSSITSKHPSHGIVPAKKNARNTLQIGNT